MEPEQAANSIGDVLARQGGAADILYVPSDSDRIRVVAANELLAPTGVPNLPSKGFAVLQNFYLPDVAIQGERDCIGDQIMSAYDSINKEVSICSLPGAYHTRVVMNATFALEGGNVGRARVYSKSGQRLLWEHQCLSLLDAQIHGRVGRLADRRCGYGQQNK